MAIIEVNNLTKEYKLGAMTSLKDNALNLLNRLRGKPAVERERFKALDNINFKIEQGEVVGIIGTNGAGKSTLLKHLAQITRPTSGEVIVRGSVAPLIEVGAGLNPELTGRENIYLNGAILGIPKKIIQQKMDEIIEFAELEQFIDTPIKRYSSGMTVRLGFAIATSIDADILIVDEVLAVGDLTFQRKCFEKMETLIKKSGRTVMLVSHNIRQIERMCSRAIFLKEGKVILDDTPSNVAELYYKHSNERILANAQQSIHQQSIESSGEISLVDIKVVDEHGNPTKTIPRGGRLHAIVRLNFHTTLENPEIVVGTHRTDFVYLTASSTLETQKDFTFSEGIHELHYIVDSFPMVPGQYCIRLSVFDKNRRPLLGGETLHTFGVMAKGTEVREPPSKTVDVDTKWIIHGETFQATLSHTQPAFSI